MRRVARALSIIALATTIGCSGALTPATPPLEQAQPIKIASARDTAPLLDYLVTPFRFEYPAIEITKPSSNHVTLLSQLQDGTIPYMVSNHLPAQNTLWAAPLARDGIAILLHPENPITNLSITDLRRIYQGHVTSWDELGGPALPITVFSREAGNSTRLEFERLVMGQQRITPNVQVLASAESLLTQLRTDESAIGYISYSLLRNTTQPITIDNIQPTSEMIRGNIYPLRTTIYIIGQQEPLDNTRQFVGWVQSAEGQAIVGSQFIPLP